LRWRRRRKYRAQLHFDRNPTWSCSSLIPTTRRGASSWKPISLIYRSIGYLLLLAQPNISLALPSRQRIHVAHVTTISTPAAAMRRFMTISLP
jgi:hypothetical protein